MNNTTYQQPYAPNMDVMYQDPQYLQGMSEANGALVFGILGLFFFHIIFGIFAISKSNAAERLLGLIPSKATAGRICGIISLCLAPLSFIALISTLGALFNDMVWTMFWVLG